MTGEELVALFRQEHPGFAADIKDDPKHGPMMRTQAMQAYISWCARNGYCTSAQAAKARLSLTLAQQQKSFQDQ